MSAERVLQRPPEVVFDHVATRHFENHPRWDPELVEMRQTSAGPVGVGTTAHVVRRQGSRRVEGTATVTEYRPHRSAAWDVRFGPFRLVQRVELTPELGGAATRLSLSIETGAQGTARFVVPLLRPRFRTAIRRSLATIDELLGSGPDRPAPSGPGDP